MKKENCEFVTWFIQTETIIITVLFSRKKLKLCVCPVTSHMYGDKYYCTNNAKKQPNYLQNVGFLMNARLLLYTFGYKK